MARFQRFRRGSYANVTATLALVVALSGTSYAAGLITSKQIKDGTIQARDIKAKTITASKIRPGSVTGTQVKDGSLTKADLKVGTLPEPTHVYTARGSGGVFHDGEAPVLASIRVPAGTYVVAAQTWAFNDTSEERNISCEIAAGDHLTRMLETISGRDGAQSPTQNVAIVTLQSVESLRVTTTISFKCRGITYTDQTSNPTRFEAWSPSVTATRVSAVTDQTPASVS